MNLIFFRVNQNKNNNIVNLKNVILTSRICLFAICFYSHYVRHQIKSVDDTSSLISGGLCISHPKNNH